ncbi:MAG: molybdenum cofactor guanylyltransferase [Ignavibacteriae bacterium HGW-Ignavibacteriae-2]|jgi:molybdopterin-guanine dinucleotide biosynthesis protein A|nr:MAG: molybdenum cofactor guanylyltransferase [Ignavibacteriae bacterium HGW-Ignavibacteriae-2]
MYKDITGIILAGGKSTRMGENKSFLKINGEFVIERVVKLMKGIFEKNIIITNTPQEYEFLKTPVFKDIYTYKGPLAGIHSGLRHSETEQNFIISCDIPLMRGEIIDYIINYKTEKPVTVCRADGFIQQLAGRYSKNVLPYTEKVLEENNTEVRDQQQNQRKCAVLSMLEIVGSAIIEVENLDFYDEAIFYNMNRPEDYKYILDKLKNK